MCRHVGTSVVREGEGDAAALCVARFAGRGASASNVRVRVHVCLPAGERDENGPKLEW